MKKNNTDSIEQLMSNLNKNQISAVNAILEDCVEDTSFVLPIIDGPPGTGKTTVGTAAIAKYLTENPNGQVLYMAYTHLAANQAKYVLEKSFGFSPQHMIKIDRGSENNWERGTIGWSDLSRNDLRRLKEAPAIFCTLYGSKKARETRKTGCKVIVDEFSQVDPSMFFTTINRIRWINPTGYSLLGDPLQLPVVTTQSILRPNICQFIRMRKPYTPHELNIQHRMNKDICSGVNNMRVKALFSYEIKTDNKVQNRNMEDFGFRWRESAVDSKYKDILDPNNPLVILNTDSLKNEEEETDGGSKKYVEEAKLAIKLAKFAHRSYVNSSGEHLLPMVLSPYTAQVYEIKKGLEKPLEYKCTTIYKSQGQEFPLVIVSFVRKNDTGHIGFLDDIELRSQAYVACSRPQAKLIVLLSKKTFVGKGHLIFEAFYNTKDAYKEYAPK